jgi:hypothetical protein
MDEDLGNLEAELSRLRPAELRGDFARRLERELGRRRPAPAAWLWIALPAAAALAVALLWAGRAAAPAPRATAAAATTAFEPVGVRDVLVSARDEGYVVLADGRPARRLLEAHVDTIVWRNPKSAASIQWSVPREELKIVPVVYQ